MTATLADAELRWPAGHPFGCTCEWCAAVKRQRRRAGTRAIAQARQAGRRAPQGAYRPPPRPEPPSAPEAAPQRRWDPSLCPGVGQPPTARQSRPRLYQLSDGRQHRLRGYGTCPGCGASKGYDDDRGMVRHKAP